MQRLFFSFSLLVLLVFAALLQSPTLAGPVGWLRGFPRSAQASTDSSLLDFPGKLVYHRIRTDAEGKIIPWFSADPGTAYDHNLRLLWGFWQRLDTCCGGVKEYLVHRTWMPKMPGNGIGGDQTAMVLSSWNLLYAYLGDRTLVANMVYQAERHLDYGLSAPTDAWPYLPYPCNTERRAVYDGDLILGKGFIQPDKAGSFGAELVMLYKLTGKQKYLRAAVNIANTLVAKVQPGDYDHSPLPFKVHAKTGEIGVLKSDKGVVQAQSTYTTNWTGTLRLLDELTQLGQGSRVVYRRAFDTIAAWLKKYPIQNQRWGPFFEDISMWSDTEINAGTMAMYLLDHPTWSATGTQDARRIQDWVINTLGIDKYKVYGCTVIGEQSVYKMEGNSHTSRHASIELRYAEVTGDLALKPEAIRQLNWATYMVDYDGKNRWPNLKYYELWWTDGYGDYVRHYLRAMAAAPELAPADQNHLLRTTDVVTTISYGSRAIHYRTFSPHSTETLRLTAKPTRVTAGGRTLAERAGPEANGFTWQPLAQGGVLRLTHQSSQKVSIWF